MALTDATRLAGDAYSTRLARDVSAEPNDQTRLAQERYQPRLTLGTVITHPNAPVDLADLTPDEYLAMLEREAAAAEPEIDEFYKVGEKIGDRYEVSAIHHGAMGVVYGCFDHETKLPRALKSVSAKYVKDRHMLDLFETEASVWISLEKHPYIVRAYLVKRFKGLPCVITEYVRGPKGMGGDLRGWIGHPRLTLPLAVTMALQIAQGMQHAVRRVPNLVHRDLKPANILVNGEGKAMVTDFGLVFAAESGAGTPAYMSPEQWRNEALDERSDIYAYGCILFEMFTAHRLFPALTERDWERAHLESQPVALISLAPELPGAIDQFVQRCIQKNVGARPQSWDEVVIFFAEWYHCLTGNAVVLDFSSLALDREELFRAGQSLENVYRFEDAIKAYERVLAIDPNCAYAWTSIGYALFCLNRLKDAVDAYDRALVISPDHENTLLLKTDALWYLAREEEYSKFTPAMLEAEDLRDQARKWLTVGGELKRRMRYEEAIKAFDRATIAPDCGGAWCGKGRCLSHLMRYEEAIQSFDRAIAIKQENASAWYGKGLALYKLERNEEALQSFDQALAIDPASEDAWTNKGLALDDLKRYEEAIEAYEKVIEINPSSDDAWLYKGIALQNLSRNAEAIQAYDLALVINATSEFALRGRQSAVDALKASG